MTIYERTMTITFETDMDDISNVEKKVQGALFDAGLAQMGTYNYDANVGGQAKKYGYHEEEDETLKYALKDNDDQTVMELDYHSQMIMAKKGLKEYGIDTTEIVVKTSTKAFKWQRIRGPYLAVVGLDIVPTMDVGRTPKYIYEEDGVELVVKFDNYGDNYDLTFTITYEVDTITDRKAVETRVVQVPLAEMQLMREIVKEVLSGFSKTPVTHLVECETRIISESTYQCSPETTKLVMGEDEEE